MRAHVTGIGLRAPGMADWPTARAILRGEARHAPDDGPQTDRSPLTGPERRRATAVTKLALAAAMEAAGPDRTRWDIRSVFASSGGEVDVCDRIFSALALPEREVSPTQFHNSVHNAAAGYWSIATGSHQPATALACFDHSFAAGLLEAVAQLTSDPGEILLIAYDQPPPFPIAPFRPLSGPFAVALRLSSHPAPGATGAVLGLGYAPADSRQPTPMSEPDLEGIRVGNPAARALPLLQALACERPARLHLACVGPGLLEIHVAEAGWNGTS